MIVPLESIQRPPNLLCLIPAYQFKLEAIWQSSDDFLTSQVDVFASLDTRCADLYPNKFFPSGTQVEKYDQMKSR